MASSSTVSSVVIAVSLSVGAVASFAVSLINDWTATSGDSDAEISSACSISKSSSVTFNGRSSSSVVLIVWLSGSGATSWASSICSKFSSLNFIIDDSDEGTNSSSPMIVSFFTISSTILEIGSISSSIVSSWLNTVNLSASIASILSLKNSSRSCLVSTGSSSLSNSSSSSSSWSPTTSSSSNAKLFPGSEPNLSEEDGGTNGAIVPLKDLSAWPEIGAWVKSGTIRRETVTNSIAKTNNLNFIIF